MTLTKSSLWSIETLLGGLAVATVVGVITWGIEVNAHMIRSESNMKTHFGLPSHPSAQDVFTTIKEQLAAQSTHLEYLREEQTQVRDDLGDLKDLLIGLQRAPIH